MKIQKQLQDILGGALGLVGMIESLLHSEKEGAAAGPPAKGKGTGSKKSPVVKGKTKEAKAGPSDVVKKKGAKKPVAAKKTTPDAPKGGTAAPAKRVKQAAATVPVKGGKKAVAGSVSKG